MEKLHDLLIRQLSRANLSFDALPSNKEDWQTFLQKINHSYLDYEQDRYLNERSLEISSEEMSELNKKLEEAQYIARMGYWFYDPNSNKIIWSKAMYQLFGYDTSQPPPSFEKFIQTIHEEDRNLYQALIKKALNEGIKYEAEIRIQCHPSEPYRWFYIMCHPQSKPEPNKIRTLSGVRMEITQRKESEIKLKELNQQLIVSARRAGMAEIATSVLHNIGNVLNSVNVSICLIQENFKHTRVDKLANILLLIEQHLPSLGDYFTNDPKGKLLPEYLITLINAFKNEREKIDTEITNVVTHINHIKDIVATQQTISGFSGLIEKVSLIEVIDTVLQMNLDALKKHHIIIKKEFEQIPTLVTDKTKLIQILNNIVQNAKDALSSSNYSHKNILLEVKKIANNQIKIIVRDNGIGISPENITRIFTFGFTTKKHGHGFGLHGSALAAKELGGSLSAESEGQDKGSTFTLTLPIEFSTNEENPHAT